MHPQLIYLLYRMLGHAAATTLALGGAIAAVDFKEQITLGSVIVTALILCIAGLFTWRSKIASVWREEAEGEKAKAERLEDELLRANEQRRRLEVQVSELKAKTDLTTAIDEIRDITRGTAEAIIAEISKTGQIRDGRTLEVLEEIRDRLPRGEHQ